MNFMNEHQRLAIQAIEQLKGDDLYRAQSAFRGMNEKQMKELFGQSGKTRAQILREYEAHNAKCDAAIAWVKSL